jgi:YD repeat-containing protein
MSKPALVLGAAGVLGLAGALYYFTAADGPAPPVTPADATAPPIASPAPPPVVRPPPHPPLVPPEPAGPRGGEVLPGLEGQARARCGQGEGEQRFETSVTLDGETATRAVVVDCGPEGVVRGLVVQDDAGRPLEARAPDGAVTRFEYDPDGREIGARTDVDGDGRPDRIARTTHEADGTRRRVEQRFRYDAEGRRTRVGQSRRTTHPDGSASVVGQQWNVGGAKLVQHHDGDGDGVPETIVRTVEGPDGRRVVRSLRDLDGDGDFDRRSTVEPGRAPKIEEIDQPVVDAGAP